MDIDQDALKYIAMKGVFDLMLRHDSLLEQDGDGRCFLLHFIHASKSNMVFDCYWTKYHISNDISIVFQHVICSQIS